MWFGSSSFLSGSRSVFHVTSKGAPKKPAPPEMLTPPLMELKWICTEAAFVACTPLLVVPV
jgi:hypothetical protein